jgi:hypothetical protein
MSEVEPASSGDLPIERDEVAMIAAALRADSADLATYERVLVGSLADSLPPGCLEVDRDRTLADRVAGRPGAPRAIRILLGEITLELVVTRGRLVGTVGKQVRGVVIARKEVPLGEWTTSFASALSAFAKENLDARAALERMLGA